MSEIVRIQAREILDSRGIPTIEVDILLKDCSFGRVSVPSGLSTGSHEAVEIRDNNLNRFNGLGVLNAVNSVNTEIASTLIGRESSDQLLIDEILQKLDGTPTKKRLGANAVLGTSLAIAKATAKSFKLPLYRYIGGINAHILPVPMMNILNGGKHADNPIDIQEFMIMPVGAKNASEAIRMGSEIFMALKSILKQSGYNTNVGDEGGFAPYLRSTDEVLDYLMKAIEAAGYQSGTEIVLALDIAANELYHNDAYHLEKKKYTADQLVNYYEDLVSNYPIFSLEDGMAEDDWEGWQLLTKQLGKKIQLVGDDLFVTNSGRLAMGIEQNTANAVLIKPNQIGTLTEMLQTVQTAQSNNYAAILSHRSGETESSLIADLSVATNCGQIKAGSPSRTDRTAKYNQLIRIEEELGLTAVFSGKSILKRFPNFDKKIRHVKSDKKKRAEQ